MGDNADPPSGAALAAQGGESSQGGFLTRLFSGAKPAADNPENQRNSHLPTGDLRNLISLRVEDVAVPRAAITAVAIDADLKKLIDVFKESGYSRLPVYKENLDNPVGFVHLKDLALKYGFTSSRLEFSMEGMLRSLLYAPPSMTIGVLLQKMQGDRVHMALVIDEFGGVDGLLTIEDLVETVVGKITDEHDTEEGALFVEEQPGIYVAQARANLAEFEAALDMGRLAEDEDEEIDTLGGLLFMMLGRVPAKGEVIRHPAGVEFHILDADPRRIKRMRIVRSPENG
ncbi:MAG: HlyC/CorC family transporter [Rhodobacteraceae bacterium]|nr:HlyC/CorC family transporter [Paracoccaceae bacterium]